MLEDFRTYGALLQYFIMNYNLMDEFYVWLDTHRLFGHGITTPQWQLVFQWTAVMSVEEMKKIYIE